MLDDAPLDADTHTFALEFEIDDTGRTPTKCGNWGDGCRTRATRR